MPESKKRKKNYYKVISNKRSRNSEELRPGMQGYVITYNNFKERRNTVHEAYRILNEYADIKYGPENPVKAEDDDDNNEINLETALQKEVSDIKKANAKGAPRRFENVSTKAKNVIFIKTNIPEIPELLDEIYADLLSTQIKKTKYCLRFLPVVCTCYAKTDNIIKCTKQCVESVFVEQFQHKIIRFCIVWKTRCNNSVKRDDVLPPILDYIYSKKEHVTDYNDPEIVMNIDVIGNICCIGFLRNYVKFKKYNIDLIVQTTEVVAEEKNVGITDDKETADSDVEKDELESKEPEKEKVEIDKDNIIVEASENIEECSTGHYYSGDDGESVKDDTCINEIEMQENKVQDAVLDDPSLACENDNNADIDKTA